MSSRSFGWWALGLLGAAVLFWLASWATGGLRPGSGWHMGFGAMSWLGGWLMMLGMLLFWMGGILGLLWLVRWAVGQAGGGGTRDEPDALELARRRYARGEVSREEYQRLVEALGGK